MGWHISAALMKDYENSRCLQAQAVESSEVTCSDGEQSAQLSENPTPQAYLCSDRMTAFSRLSRYGMTFAPLTEGRGEDLLTWFLEGFRARPSLMPQLDETMQKTYGRRCGESWQMSLPHLSMPRTYRQRQSTLLQRTSSRWVTKPEHFPLARQTWAVTTKGSDIGYLHTPTTQGNYCAESMQKWPSCRAWVATFGVVTPEAQEWLMGWPIGWTELKPLEMDKWHAWHLSHSGF